MCSISASEIGCDSNRPMIEGVILATGMNPIPEAYRHGQIVRINLAFLDQDENQIRETADLLVDRLWKPKHKFAPCKTGLFDRGRVFPTQEPVNSQEDSSLPQVPRNLAKGT
jgi:hypothetical protein